MRLACIDVGSNTTRLLVAESIPGGIRDLRNERAFTLLGRSIASDGCIPSDKIAETAATVAGQVALARELGAESVRAVATAAIRQAANAADLSRAVEREASLQLEVLGGEEEARLAYRGAAHVLGGSGTLAVVDVGGGSTEIAFGDAHGRIEYATSVEMGSSLLAERHFANDPPGDLEIEEARAAVRRAFETLEPRAVDRAVAIGGSASSLQHLAGGELGEEEMGEALHVLRGDSTWEVAKRLELDPERVRLLPAGLLVLEEVSRRLQRRLRICKGGLREGVILEMIRRSD